jgi:hypothetical protein
MRRHHDHHALTVAHMNLNMSFLAHLRARRVTKGEKVDVCCARLYQKYIIAQEHQTRARAPYSAATSSCSRLSRRI